MEIHNPHDRFFKDLMEQPEVARDFLTQYLPPEIAACLDLSQPVLVDRSLIDERLQELQSDLIFRVALRDGDPAYVYVLFEHKSHPDPLSSFQVLCYSVRLWERDLESGNKLIPIVPVLFYHGIERWTAARDVHGLFEVPAALAPYVPNCRYVLHDLSAYSDEEIRGVVLLQVLLLTMKYVFRDELPDRLPRIFGLLNELHDRRTGLQYVETVLRYLTAAAESIDDTDLTKALQATFAVEGGTIMPTLAQKWKEEGLAEGLERGIERGRVQGLQDGIELALRLRFGREGIRLMPEVRDLHDAGVLERIMNEIESVETPDDLRRLWQS